MTRWQPTRRALNSTAILTMALLGSTMDVSAADAIQPVNSWTEFRAQLISGGRSAAEADSHVSEMLASLTGMDRSAGDDRIGIEAPPFQFDAWLNSPPLSMQALRGKVVLVRWWTDTCPFCASSAPALRSLHDSHASKGLVVIGVFHPKDGRDDPADIPRVQRAVEARRFTFPVAIDWEWRTRTLHDWWLTGPDRPATSVTFLVDKGGLFQFVHPGMEYHHAEDTDSSHEATAHTMCANDMANIEDVIERLLAE
jgi:peroxiredoxin